MFNFSFLGILERKIPAIDSINASKNYVPAITQHLLIATLIYSIYIVEERRCL